MEINFDISEDELPIFLAEVDEHLQVLDDILMRLEREETDSELVQTVFRSAHTIKGMAGMIGHRRMTDLTHTVETALDGVRKKSLQISTELINLCLEAVDYLRQLRDEVVTSQVCDVNTEGLITALKEFMDGKALGTQPAIPVEASVRVGASEQSISEQKSEVASAPKTEVVDASAPGTRTIQVLAKIDLNSIAPAARAFQLMQALQDMGDIIAMIPTLEQIDSMVAVADFSATVRSSVSLEIIASNLLQISGVDEISIDGVRILEPEATAAKPQTQAAPVAQPDRTSQSNSGSAISPTPVNGDTLGRRTSDANGRKPTEVGGRRGTDMTVRTNVERLDNLMNLVGELITDRNHLQKIRGRLVAQSRQDGNVDELVETVTHLGRITDQLQEEVMRIRMLPIGSVFNRFPRTVRDLSQKIGKLIDVVIHGEDTEMDRSMIEEINDPLIHLIRNSVDHGVETPQERLAAGKPERGTITLTARHEQGRIILTVSDDGGGIDGERLRRSAVQKGLITPEEAAALTEEQSIDLMFMAGLSTAQKISDISGRGVGLDIVNTNIQRVNGTIQVETKLGQGTTFQIALPLTLAIVPSLLVTVQQATFAIPLVMISETLRLERSEVKNIYRKPVTLLRGNVLSLVRLADIYHFEPVEEQKKYLYAVVVHSGKQRVGLLVDSLLGEEEVVVKPLGSFIGDIPGVSSATILGDGMVALIVDVFGLFKMVGI